MSHECSAGAAGSRPQTTFDHHDPGLGFDSVFDTYAQMRQRRPVAWSDAHGGFWVLTRYADVLAGLRDHRTYSSARGVHVPRHPDAPMIIPIDFDPPEHRWYRRLFEPLLDAAVVDRFEADLRQLIRHLLDDVASDGGGDLVEQVAVPLPLQVLCRLMGIAPATASQLRDLTARLWEDFGGDEGPTAIQAMVQLMMGEVELRRREPREDYLTWLAGTTVHDRPITEAEVQSTLLTMAAAGHETTVNTVGSMLLHLGHHPDLQMRIRQEPEVISRLVEEILRLYTPAHLFARTLTRDVEIDGITMSTGDKVLLVYAAADRDPDQFDHPDELDLDGPTRRHLAFGWGIHHCVGAHLARRELRIILEELIELPPFRLDGEPQMSGLIGGHHMGVHRLPVTFS